MMRSVAISRSIVPDDGERCFLQTIILRRMGRVALSRPVVFDVEWGDLLFPDLEYSVTNGETCFFQT